MSLQLDNVFHLCPKVLPFINSSRGQENKLLMLKQFRVRILTQRGNTYQGGGNEDRILRYPSSYPELCFFMESWGKPVLGFPACVFHHSVTLFDLTFPRVLAG